MVPRRIVPSKHAHSARHLHSPIASSPCHCPAPPQAYFGGYVCANYAYLARVAGLNAPQLAELAANSFRASFLLDAAAKERHCAEVAAALREWQATHSEGDLSQAKAAPQADEAAAAL